MPISSYSSIAHLFGKDPVNFSQLKTYILSNTSPPTGFRWNTNDLAICMTLSLPFFLLQRKSLLKIFGIASVTLIVAMTASRAFRFPSHALNLFPLPIIRKKTYWNIISDLVYLIWHILDHEPAKRKFKS